MSRKPRRARNPELYDVAAGQRMAALFDRARVELGLRTDAELWQFLELGRDTAQAWMRGERPPSRETGTRVAAKLGISYADLLAEYDGTAPTVDSATLIAAFEWAIRQVRAGVVPPDVAEAVETARASSERRHQTRRSGERATNRRTES